jgi:uncharacterized protein (TIGR00369 family)
MTAADHGGDAAPDERDIETPDSVQARFGIDTLETNPSDATVVMTMSVAGMVNPFTGTPCVGPLAILVDAASGLVNHIRRPRGHWTVSSELSLELSPEGTQLMFADVDVPVVASARPLGPADSTSLSFCTLTSGDGVVGGATVRSYYIAALGGPVGWPDDTFDRTRQATLAELMSVRIRPADGSERVLAQEVDPILNNAIGVVHGGVSSAALELVASAAVHGGRSERPMRTGSVRVNFLRPFLAGRDSRYVGTALRVGRGTSVGDAQAIGDDGKVAVIARVTAYR